ncbi:MAG: hypothetical protein GF421_00540 [Candidatus Aminicenantes bacterium]|nr:hypothetical protein [Candidatus Aminicenantes bacterium]
MAFIIKKGIFQNLIIFFGILILIQFPVSGESQCQSPINDEKINRLCDQMMAGFQAGHLPNEVKNRITEEVLNHIKIGDQGTFGRVDGCFEAARIQVNLFYETEDKVMLDELIDLGDHRNRDIILVKSCQKRDAQDLGDDYASLSVQIFLRRISATSLKIKTGQSMLSVGDTTEVEAELLCGECALDEKIVDFSIQGPGDLNPLNQSTDSSGKAKTTYQATQQGEATISVRYQDQTASTALTTLYVWDLECHFYYKEHHPEFDDVKGNYNDRWQSDVRFENVPLSRFVQMNIVEEEPGSTQYYTDYLEWMKLPKTFQSQGTFYGENFTYYDGMDLFRGYAKGKPEWILGIGITADDITPSQDTPDDGKLKKVLVISLEHESVMVHYNEKVEIKTPYPLRFQKRIKIPEEKILAGKPFTIKFEDPPGSYYIDGGEIKCIPRTVY